MTRLLLFFLILLAVLGSVYPAEAQVAPLPGQRSLPRGIIYIPAIGLTRYIRTAPPIVVDGSSVYDLTQLGDGVAWLEGTGWVQHPNGRIALAGHNPGAFSRLSELQPGDPIYLITAMGLARFVAAEFYTVDPADTWMWNSPGEGQTLLLVTCSDVAGNGEQRLVIIAEKD